MKKVLLIVISAVVTVASWADGRSPQQMLRIAQQRLGTDVKEVSTSNNNAAKGQVQTSAYCMYQAQSGGGFVIVGADDRLPEILGYTGATNAYIRYTKSTGESAALSGAIKFNVVENTPDGVSSAKVGDTANTTKDGKYLNQRHLVVVKNGRQYNAAGQRLK